MFENGLSVLKFGSDVKMAPQRGFEPPTYPLGGDCSIQLSYRGVAWLSTAYGAVLAAETKRVSRVCACHPWRKLCILG